MISAGSDFRAELLALVARLGKTRLALEGLGDKIDVLEHGDSTGYIVYRSASESLAELAKILSEDRELISFSILGQAGVMQSDLIHIVRQASENSNMKLYELVLTVVVMLVTIRHHSLELMTQDCIDILRDHKRIILQSGIIKVVSLETIECIRRLEKNSGNFGSSRDERLITLGLKLIAELSCIRDQQRGVIGSSAVEINSNLQEDLVNELSEMNTIEFILCMAASIRELPIIKWRPLLLKIFYGLLGDQDPKSIACYKRSHSRLAQLVDRENLSISLDKNKCSRHPLFGGTISVRLNDGTSYNIHNPEIAMGSLRDCIEPKKVPSYRTVPSSIDVAGTPKKSVTRLSDKTVDIYAQLSIRFIDNCFHDFFTCIKEDIDSGRYTNVELCKGQFFYLMSYFMDYVLLLPTEDDMLGAVTAFVNKDALRFIMKNIKSFSEERKWDKVLVTLECLTSFLGILLRMMTASVQSYKYAAEIVLDNMFGDTTYSDIVIGMASNISIKSIRYYKAYIMAVNMYMRLLSELRKCRSGILTAKTKRKNRDDGPSTIRYKEILLDELEEQFVRPRVAEIHSKVLARYKELSECHIEAITRYFSLVTRKYNYGQLIFSLLNLYTFHTIIHDKATLALRENFQHLYRFINYYLSKMFEYASNHPYILLQAMIPNVHKKSDYNSIFFVTGQNDMQG